MKNKIKYISPTSFFLFKDDVEEFYIQRLATVKPDKLPQTPAMAVGSAFDIIVKRELQKHFGLSGFDFDAMVKSQLEVEDKAGVLEHGEYIFKSYVLSGAFQDLILEMNDFTGEPRFEYSITGTIDGVPLLGKPDLKFVNKAGQHIIHDWKVNGYCSRGGASPNKGYIKIRDGWDHTMMSPSKNTGQPHKDAIPMLVNGVWINAAQGLELLNDKWAVQLAIYSWVSGEPVGGDFLVGIDQVTAKNLELEKPFLRISSYRNRIERKFQENLIKELKEMWEILQSDWIFRSLSHDESVKHQAFLDAKAESMVSDGSSEDSWFTSATRFRFMI